MLKNLYTFILLLTAAGLPLSCQPANHAEIERRPPGTGGRPWRNVITPASGGLMVWSPNQKQYVINQADSAGIFQLYVGKAGQPAACITCTQQPNSPAP